MKMIADEVNVKFQSGSEIDRHQCMAIQHEFLRCKESFQRFEAVLDEMEHTGHTRELAHRAYNSYSTFILHLYELVLSTQAREFNDTSVLAVGKKSMVTLKRDGGDVKVKKSEALDLLITGVVARVLNQRIHRAELEGFSGASALAFLERLNPVPEEFSEEFRIMRNKVAGHVTYERISKIDLSSFYELYDDYLYLLYVSIGEYWVREAEEFPDFEQVTNFLSTLYKSNIGG